MGNTDWHRLVYFILYYFQILINKFNFKTPGREAETTTETVETTERAKTIIEGLGGKENIEIVDCCATRLRVTLKSDAPVNKQLLNSTEARGIIQKVMVYKLFMDHMSQR